ncbi:uncharacterized protein K452DRAFT_204014, partial [Aplosporella prunicola CBS 121167]
IYWRVQDEYSGTYYSPGYGFFARDTSSEIDFTRNHMVHDALAKHLDWGNRCPTPFISVYCDEETAFEEADRRVLRRNGNVTVSKIHTRRSQCPLEYRNVQILAIKHDVWIPERAFHNSKFEYVFLHHIPAECI